MADTISGSLRRRHAVTTAFPAIRTNSRRAGQVQPCTHRPVRGGGQRSENEPLQHPARRRRRCREPSAQLSRAVEVGACRCREALRALSDATNHAADALIPPASIGEGAARRYARAAASWPLHGEGAPPSYERQAQILAALHNAAATLRPGAERCRRAREIMASTIPDQQDM
jgi:hypothetical protein